MPCPPQFSFTALRAAWVDEVFLAGGTFGQRDAGPFLDELRGGDPIGHGHILRQSEQGVEQTQSHGLSLDWWGTIMGMRAGSVPRVLGHRSAV